MCRMQLFIFLLYLNDHVWGKFFIIKTKQETNNSDVKRIGEDFSLGKAWDKDLQIVFEKEGPFQVTKNHKLHQMKSLGKEFRISCEIELSSTSFSKQYYNIFHFTTGKNGGKTGRIPAVWMQRNGLLLVSMTISGKGNTFKEIYYGRHKRFPLLIQQYHERGEEYVFQVLINGRRLWSVANHSPEEYSNVDIYAGDPWYEALSGTIKNLKVETSDSRPTSSTTSTSIAPSTSESDCKCGLAKRNNRIVGGQETGVNEYPWQVGILHNNNKKPSCGGSLISNQWILTAAHCTKNPTLSSYNIVLGEHNFKHKGEADSIQRSISKIVNHPKYSKSTDDYDFSLVKMAKTVDFSEYPNIRPICLPIDKNNKYINVNSIVTGWGRIDKIPGSSFAKQPDMLMEVDLKVISNTACQKKIWTKKITNQMLCAYVAGVGNACSGDSGGPLITAGSGSGETAGQNYELIGVVSWGRSFCEHHDSPGVYARVTEQLDWIKTTTASGWSTCLRH